MSHNVDPVVQSPRGPEPRAGARMLLRAFLAGRGRQCVASAAVAVLVAATNGAMVLLLVPALRLATGHGTIVTAHHAIDGLRDQLSSRNDPLSMGVILGLFVLLAAANGGLLCLRSVIDGKLIHGFSRSLRNQLFASLTCANWQLQSSTRMADVAHALSAEIERIQKGIMGLLVLAGHVTLLAGMMLTSFLITPQVSMLALTGCLLVWPLLRYPNQLTRQSARELTEKSRSLYRDVLDQLAGLKESKVLCAEERHLRNFARITDDISQAGVRQQRALGLMNLAFSLGGAMSLCGLLLAGTTFLQTSLPELMVTIVVFVRLAPRLRLMQSHYQQLLHALPAYQTVVTYQKLFDDGHEVQIRNAGLVTKQAAMFNVSEPTADSHGTIDVRSHLSAEDVTYCYPGESAPALAGINVQLPAGLMTAIVGPSGSGKSTLADILLGLLLPTEGTVDVDGVELTSAMTERWRKSVGYVPQDPFLFHGTVRTNLRWARHQASDSEMEAVLKQAAIDLSSDSFPLGLDTDVGDRGSSLSGGERQRITLARALLRQPSVLILDEATSSLDRLGQQQILASLQALRGHVTIVMIAHDASVAREADHIVFLKDGIVCGEGSWNSLWSENMSFRTLMYGGLLNDAA